MPMEQSIDRLLHAACILTCSRGFTMKSMFLHHACASRLSSGGWWHDNIWLPIQTGLNKGFFSFMWVGWSVAQIKRPGWPKIVSDLSVPCSLARGIFFKLSQNFFGVYCLYRQLLYMEASWLQWNIINDWFETHKEFSAREAHGRLDFFLLTSHYLSIVFSIKSISK